PDLSLHIALVEDEVHYSGENGLRFHPQVVRNLARAAGADEYGFKVDPSRANNFEHTFDLDAISAENLRYYDEWPVERNKEVNARIGGDADFDVGRFKEQRRLINPDKLSVVAFLQDNKTRQILQSVFLRVAPAGKEGAGARSKWEVGKVFLHKAPPLASFWLALMIAFLNLGTGRAIAQDNTDPIRWTIKTDTTAGEVKVGGKFNCPAQGFSIHNRVGFAQRFGWRGIAQFACYRAHLSTQCASMKLTLQIQLLPDQEQATNLKSTIERFNQACSWLAKQAFESKTANKITLQQKYYYELREKFDLSAQMAAICIRHVGGTYSRDKSILPV